MADYVLIGSASVVQVLGPKVTQESVVATISTVPSGVTASIALPQVDFDAGTAATILESLAQSIESIMRDGKAIRGSSARTLDASGLEEYFVTFEVGYNPPGAPSGTVTADVDVPVGILASGAEFGANSGLAEAEAMVAKVYANLVALSGGPVPSAPAAPAAPLPAASTGATG